MSENSEKAIEQDNDRRLSAAILEVKSAMAEREDVVHEIRDLQRTRLELLVQEIQDVIDDAPDDQGFDFAISAGAQPRLWIDAVAHVSIARDRRTYRFVRDTRAGRVVLAESSDMKPVNEAITRYVAERIVERGRQLEATPAAAPPAGGEAARGSELAGSRAHAGGTDRKSQILSGFAMIMLGVLIGGAIVVALLRDRIPELSQLF